jgi:arsenate reductase
MKFFSICEHTSGTQNYTTPLIDFIQEKVSKEQSPTQFICTHNSRRSHLSQVWAQTAAAHFNVKNVFCYSGGRSYGIIPNGCQNIGTSRIEVLPLSEGKTSLQHKIWNECPSDYQVF